MTVIEGVGNPKDRGGTSTHTYLVNHDLNGPQKRFQSADPAIHRRGARVTCIKRKK